ncbi:hypothetical protein HDR63_01210 [bacterium]|nr:hypothetical protein [bacterium]
MKKYVILTSVLALAACGGGHHHDGGAIVAPERMTVNNMTGMGTSVTNKSKVIADVEDKLGDLNALADQVSPQMARAATTAQSQTRAGGMTMDQKYELALKLIAQAKETLRNLNQVTIDDNNLNDVIHALILAGQNIADKTVDGVKDIVSNIKPDDAMTDIDKIVDAATQKIDDVNFAIIAIEDEGTIGSGTLKIQTDGQNIRAVTMEYEDDDAKFQMTPAADGQSFTTVVTGGDYDETFHSEIFMLGKNHGLKYADFGYVENTQIDEGATEVSREYLTGGYDVMKIEPEVDAKMEFSGTAVATVWNSPEEAYLNVRDDKATLTFDNGNETMDMHFDNWYNVTMTNNSIKFDGTVADERFVLDTAENPDNNKVILNTNYYGDGSISEATAHFGYVEGAYTDDDDTLKGFTGAFGGKIK